METAAPSNSSIMAEIALNNLTPEQQQELGMNPSELADAEKMQEQLQQGGLAQGEKGFLNTPDGKYHNLSPSPPDAQAKELGQKITEQHKLSEAKSSDPKPFNMSHGSKSTTPRNPLVGKRFSSQSARPESESGAKLSGGNRSQPLMAKTAQMVLSKLSATPVKAQTADKTPGKQMNKEVRKEPQKAQARATDGKQSGQTVKEQQRGNHESIQEQKDRDSEKQKREDEQEGSAEHQPQQQEQERPDQENSQVAACTERGSLKAQVEEYGRQDSIMSEILGMRANQFDVLIIFFEFMKVLLNSKDQQIISRRQQRDLQLDHMDKVVRNYKSQAKAMLFTGIGAGLMGIVSGMTPIVGHMKGDWMIDKLSGFMSSMEGMKKKQFIESVMRMTQTMSEMQKNVQEIQKTKHEGGRSFDESMKDIYRSDYDESTRTMEEIKDHWKSIENFLYQSLQMYHDTSRQLYS